MVPRQTVFERRYEVTLVDAPSSGQVDLSIDACRSGTVHTLLISPTRGPVWTAALTVGDRGGSGVFGTASPTCACVVLNGSAFLVDVLEPERSARIRHDGPVRDVVELADEGLLLVTTGWTITAVGAGEVRWATNRLSVESIRLDEVVDHHLNGVADPDDEAREFVVDLQTGAVQGGSI